MGWDEYKEHRLSDYSCVIIDNHKYDHYEKLRKDKNRHITLLSYIKINNKFKRIPTRLVMSIKTAIQKYPEEFI